MDAFLYQKSNPSYAPDLETMNLKTLSLSIVENFSFAKIKYEVIPQVYRLILHGITDEMIME